MTTREGTLIDLLNFSKTVEELQQELKSFPWDFDGSPVIFLRSHLLQVLLRFLSEEINEVEVENWANLVEGREDIDFENDFSNELSQVIYQLANPELEGKLDIQKCKEIIVSLQE